MKIENIKFKAFSLDNGEWVEGNLRTSKSGNAMIIPIEYSGTFPVVPSTVCQFTGMKDSEGNEIWEGDILEGESKSEVVYTKGTFTISFIGYNKRVFSYPLCYYIKEDGTVDGKVIGNKFDKEK